MIKKMLQFRLLFIFFILFFLTGCYTQLRTVKQAPQKDYNRQAEQQIYEPEYQEETADTIYQVYEEQQPLYQYNFYGNDPYYWSDYYSPYYNSFSIQFGFHDPWYHSSFYFDPWYSWHRPYRPYWHRWYPYHSWGSYYAYSGYWGGYGYYGYNPYRYYGYSPYHGYFAVKEQNRRDFGRRQGLESRSPSGTSVPYMSAVATNSKKVSRVQRIRKNKSTTVDRARSAIQSSRDRTRKIHDTKQRVISTKPVKKQVSKDRTIKTIRRSRVSPTVRDRKSRTRINTESRTKKPFKIIRSRKTYSQDKKKPTVHIRKKKTNRTYPTRSKSYRSKSSSRSKSYKPRTNRSHRTRSTPTRRSSSQSKSSSGSKKSSSSKSKRTEKK